MSEIDLSNIDFSPFIRSAYYDKSISDLLKDANTNKFSAYELGSRYDHANDFPNALKYYKLADQLGDIGASFKIAMILHKQSHYKEAAPYFEEAIRRSGDVDAYVYLAEYYLLGKIGSFFGRDKKSYSLLSTAAKKGYAKAQYLLSLSYRDGVGVSKDMREYVFWMRCAQRNGYPKAIDYINTAMSDSQYTQAWKKMIAEADTRAAHHREYFDFERLTKEILKGDI